METSTSLRATLSRQHFNGKLAAGLREGDRFEHKTGGTDNVSHDGGILRTAEGRAYVIVEYPSGARAMLDLCMFAENSVDNEHVVIVGDEGKLESLLPSLTLRHGRREDWGRRETWGQPSGTGKGVAVRRVWDTNIKYAGQHFGASYIEHQHFAAAIRNGTPPEITLEEGLRSVATGLAAHRSIETGRAVLMSEVLPVGW